MASTFPTSLDTFTNPTASSLLTSPSHSLSHSDLNDAVEALEAKVRIGNTVLGNYISYTPTFPLGLSLGNGVVTSEYCRVNDFVHYWGRVVLGNTSSMSNFGLQVSMPVSHDSSFSSTTGMTTGFCTFRDISAGINQIGVIRPIETFPNTASLAAQDLVNTYLTTSTVQTDHPFTWTTGDFITWSMYYQAA
jgi:hypothetical protein